MPQENTHSTGNAAAAAEQYSSSPGGETSDPASVELSEPMELGVGDMAAENRAAADGDAHHEAVQVANAALGQDDGRAVRAVRNRDAADDSKVFVGGLPHEAGEKDIKEHFSQVRY